MNAHCHCNILNLCKKVLIKTKARNIILSAEYESFYFRSPWPPMMTILDLPEMILSVTEMDSEISSSYNMLFGSYI